MKNLSPTPAKGKTSLVKRLLVIVAFFAPVLTGSLTTPAEVKANTEVSYNCGISDGEVVKYMNQLGYVVYRLEPQLGTCNKIATTQNPYKTIIYIEGGCIVNAEDIP